MTAPRYPVFIPTRGRINCQLSAKMFSDDGVPFRLVVERGEADEHSKKWGSENILVLPESGRGLVYSRNWIKDFATAEGHARHWQFDDDVRRMVRYHKGHRLTCPPGIALSAAEDFADRYENVALLSFNSYFFFPTGGGYTLQQWPPFYLNQRCYTDFLISNSLPNRWRGRYNEDTDMTLQVLADGHCTILINAFLIDTPTTMIVGGGQMSSPSGSYQGDGRLRMARELERRWPFIVNTKRRFKRPQHVIRNNWGKFDTPLRPRRDAMIPRSYDLKLEAACEPKSESLRALIRGED